MLSLKEIYDKAEIQLRNVKNYMDRNGFYDYKDCSRLLYGGLKRSTQRELHETIRNLTVKEFMFKGSTTGTGSVDGSSYLLATVLADKIYVGLSSKDVVPNVAADVAYNLKGETVYIPYNFIKAQEEGEGGGGILGSMNVGRATLTYNKWRCPLIAAGDIIEDAGVPLMDLAAKQAGQALAQKANDQLCTVLKRTTGTTGLGTKQTAAAGADTTTAAQVATMAAQVASGGDGLHGTFNPDLLVCSPEAWHDAINQGVGGWSLIQQSTEGNFKPRTVVVNSLNLGTVASNRLTNAVSFVIERDIAVFAARKNWLRIENFADPVSDLYGSVVSGRQGCAEIVDSAIGILTES